MSSRRGNNPSNGNWNKNQSNHRNGNRNFNCNWNRNQPSNANQKSAALQAIEDEWDPVFCLGHFWKAREFFEEKVPHLFVDDSTTKVRFLVCGNDTNLAARTRFYKELKDLQDQVNINKDNGKYLYFIFIHCVKNQSLSDWKQIVEDREAMTTAAGRALTAAHLEEDVQKFVKYHDSCDPEDLLNNQRTYISRITKPVNMSPTKFKNKMVKINSLINSIPEAKDHDVFSDTEMKNMVFNAMPKSWRERFQEVGRRSATETLDSIASFFDMYFKAEQRGSSSSQNNNNRRNNDRNGRRNDRNYCQRNGNNQHQGESNGARNNGNGRRNNGNNRAEDNHHNDNAQGTARGARSQRNQPADDISVGTARTSATTELDPYTDNFAYEKEATLKDDNVPMTYITAKSGENSHTFRKVLFDSGGTYSSIMRSSVPQSTYAQLRSKIRYYEIPQILCSHHRQQRRLASYG